MAVVGIMPDALASVLIFYCMPCYLAATSERLPMLWALLPNIIWLAFVGLCPASTVGDLGSSADWHRTSMRLMGYASASAAIGLVIRWTRSKILQTDVVWKSKAIDKRALATVMVGTILCIWIPSVVLAKGANEILESSATALNCAWLLISPCLLAIIARRRPFLWGLAPLTMCLVLIFVSAWRLGIPPNGYGAVYMLGCIVVICAASSGVGVAIRSVVRKHCHTSTPLPAEADVLRRESK